MLWAFVDEGVPVPVRPSPSIMPTQGVRKRGDTEQGYGGVCGNSMVYCVVSVSLKVLKKSVLIS